eukprot:g3756.t1
MLPALLCALLCMLRPCYAQEGGEKFHSQDGETESVLIQVAMTVGGLTVFCIIVCIVVWLKDKGRDYSSAADIAKRSKKEKLAKMAAAVARRKARIVPVGGKRSRPKRKRLVGEVPGEHEILHMRGGNGGTKRLKATDVLYGDILDSGAVSGGGGTLWLRHQTEGPLAIRAAEQKAAHDRAFAASGQERPRKKKPGLWERGNMGRKSYHPTAQAKKRNPGGSSELVKRIYSHTGIDDRY